MLKEAYRRGEPPPDMLEFFDKAPELREDLVTYWRAYDDLSTCRQYAGMSGVPLPIPWIAIDQYAIRHRFTGDAYDDLVTIVRAMDEAFREHAMEKMPQDGNSS